MVISSSGRMKNEQIITFEGDYIKAISNGEKNAATTLHLFTSIRDACVEHNCFNVLGLSNSTKYLSVSEGYDTAKVFTQLGITAKYRIAWVELNPIVLEDAYFIETVLKNRGFPGRFFANASEAKAWLLREVA